MSEPNSVPALQETLKILVITRFSYLGASGWRGEASKNAALLFAPDRLQRRLSLFKAINLESLKRQSAQNFHHYILTSDRLPSDVLTELRAICLAAYGDESRFTIDQRPPAPARRWLRVFMAERYGAGTHVTQVVLDDDDGLASDFMSTMQSHLASELAERPEEKRLSQHYLSYPLGYALDVSQAESSTLYLHRYPYINLGLTLHMPATDKNILAIAHLKNPPAHGCKLYDTKPMFLRGLHGFNDSSISPAQRWTKIPDWTKLVDIQKRFGFMTLDDAPWTQG